MQNPTDTNPGSDSEAATNVSCFELEAIVAKKRASQPPRRKPVPFGRVWEPPRVRGSLEEACQRLLARTDQGEGERYTRMMRERQQTRPRGESRLSAFLTSVGPRYQACELENFEVKFEDQTRCLSLLRGYAGNIAEEVATGNGVLLFGPTGTGKDHLLIGLARIAIQQHHIGVQWVNGLDLFGRFRDIIGTAEQEASVIVELASPDVLVLSDPLPPTGSLTEHQVAMLLRLLDARYRALRPTWATLNVANSEEADARLGAPLVDRLRDGALAIRCDWVSYRRPKVMSRSVPTRTRTPGEGV